ncbi:MAG: cytochrome C oxidase subunit IV family protein [Terracidiphilus sp.]
MSEGYGQAEEIVSPWVYAAVYLALLAGVGLTIAASYLKLGILNPILVLTIAFAQATLVALYSMHLKWSTKLNMLSVGACIFIYLFLIAMVLLDYISRAWGSW